MVKIAAISDTHNLHTKLSIPSCDILIHAGDATSLGKYEETIDFLLWLSSLDQCKHKVFVPGNHDFFFQGNYKEHVPGNVNVLIDRSVTLEGLKIHGTPWTPFFYDWAFNGLEKKIGLGYNYRGGPGECTPDHQHPLLKVVYSYIADDTDVIVCHGPPRIGKIDYVTRNGEHVGSYEMKDRIDQLPNLKIGIYGHIHSGHGNVKYKGATHYNVSICDDSYAPSNPVTIIDL